MKKCRWLPFCVVLLFAACEENSNFWTAETCNSRLEADVVDFEEYQQRFREANEAMDVAARRGDIAGADANKRSAESIIENTKSLLAFFDSNIMPVCEGKFRQDLLDKVAAARAFAQNTAPGTAEAEGMPDIRVTAIESAFVPYELNEHGECNGPYLDVTYTVSNQGSDYPRPVDLQTYTERAQRNPEELAFFTLVGELDFGNNLRKSVDIEVSGGSGGMVKSGSSLKLRKKIRVDYNQKSAKAWGYVQTTAFLKNGNDNVRYEAEIDFPIWDIYTVSHTALSGKDPDNGKTYIGAKATVTNLGRSPTPGPIQASFMINEEESGKYINGWTGKTDGPVSGNADIYAKIPHNGQLPPRIKVNSSIIPLCPDGTVGHLNDGDTTNNIRILEQQ